MANIEKGRTYQKEDGTIIATVVNGCDAENVDIEASGNVTETDVQSAIYGLDTRITSLEEDSGSSSSSTTTTTGRKVLMLGNSFTQDATNAIATICSNLGLSTAYNNITYTYHGSSTLATWASYLGDSTMLAAPITVYGSTVASGSMTLETLLAKDWDIVTVQQSGVYADTYSTYKPYFAQLANAIRRYCTNKAVKVGFHMIWGTYNESGTNGADYADIVTSAQSLLDDYGRTIEVFIPNGTAIENLRGTSLNTDEMNNFSNNTNYWHLADGAAEYTAACCLCQTLFGDILDGVSIYDDTSTISVSGGTGELAVTADNREIFQRCAMYACVQPFETISSSILEA